jgi:hypothetical protein
MTSRAPLTALGNAKRMLDSFKDEARSHADALRAFDRRISREYTALRRWHHSEYQDSGEVGNPWVGDITDAEGTHPLRESDWRATVESAQAEQLRLRTPLVGRLQAAQARVSYWRAECDRLSARKAS